MVERKSSELTKRLRNGVEYTCTMNPADERQFYLKSNRWNKVYNTVHKDLFDEEGVLRYVKRLELYPDLSAPERVCVVAGKYPRIHWHGFIVFDDVVSFMSEQIMSLHHYSIEWDTIEDRDFFYKYATKFIRVYPFYSKFEYHYDDADRKKQLKKKRQKKVESFIPAFAKISESDSE